MRQIKTSNDQGHRRACVPVALSQLLNRPYGEVNAWLKHRRYRKHDNCGTYTERMNMSELGLVKVPTISNSTVNQFLNTPEGKEGEYLVLVRGHVLAVKNGIAFDTIDSEKKRIKERWKRMQDKLPDDWDWAQDIAKRQTQYKSEKLKKEEQRKKQKEYQKKLKQISKEKRKDPNFKLEQLLKRKKQWESKLKKAQTYLKKITSKINRLQKQTTAI